MAGKTSRLNLQFDKNPIEAVRDAGSDIAKGVGDSLRHDLAEAAVSDLWSQLLGAEKKPQHQEEGELAEGQEVTLSKKETTLSVEPGIDYVREIIHAETTIRSEDHQELRQKIEQITVELKMLSESSKELQVQFKNVTVEALPQNPGKYHLNFFEWMLQTIQTARMNIESSAAWSGAVTGKKNRKDYWSLTKKHGTSFSLSGERVVAQQVG